jgi:hypothetical protein
MTDVAEALLANEAAALCLFMLTVGVDAKLGEVQGYRFPPASRVLTAEGAVAALAGQDKPCDCDAELHDRVVTIGCRTLTSSSDLTARRAHAATRCMYFEEKLAHLHSDRIPDAAILLRGPVGDFVTRFAVWKAMHEQYGVSFSASSAENDADAVSAGLKVAATFVMRVNPPGDVQLRIYHGST